MSEQTLALPGAFPFYGDAAADFRFKFNVFSALRKALGSESRATSVTIMTRADFLHHVTLHMPDVAARIDEEDFGILHLEMGAMKLATQEAIASYGLHTVRRHFSFIGYLFEHADAELGDAILVSYLEPLFIGNGAPEYRNARSLLPVKLEAALKDAERRFSLLDSQFLKYLPTQPGPRKLSR